MKPPFLSPLDLVLPVGVRAIPGFGSENDFVIPPKRGHFDPAPLAKPIQGGEQVTPGVLRDDVGDR